MISKTYNNKIRTEDLTGSINNYQLVPVYSDDDSAQWTAPKDSTFPQSVRDYLGNSYVPKTKIVDWIKVHGRQDVDHVAIQNDSDRLHIRDHYQGGYAHNDCLLEKPFILENIKEVQNEFGTVIRLKTSRGDLNINPDQTPELDYEALEVDETYKLSYTSKTWTGRKYDRTYTFESVSFD